MTSRGRLFGTIVALCVGMFGICGALQADPLFNPQVPHDVGDGPGSVAIGDLDGNGNLDLVVANEISDDVTVLLATAGGGFVLSGTYGAGTEPCSVALGLLDGDDALDLAVANRNSGNVSVFLGVGDGTLGTAANCAAGASPSSVVMGDLNEDDDLDLVVSNSSDHDVSILLGNGDGTFQAAVDYAAGTNPSQVAIGYLNGDTHLDLAVANQFSSDVSVLLGNGDGTFQTASHHGLGSYQFPSAVAIGYLNADSNGDLVVAREASSDVAVLLGNGDGTFQTPVYYSAGSSPFSVAIEDLDLDGDEDLAVADFANTGLVWILLGNGDGTFPTATSYGAQSKASCVAIGDLDQAGTPDLAVTNYGSDTVSVFLNTKETCSDTDHDGYGFPAHVTCSYPEEDCDDGNPDINPGESEICNGIDDDCSGATADGADELWLGSSCDGADTDLCQEGTYSCVGGAPSCSDLTGNDLDVCDGLDNDCNGATADGADAPWMGSACDGPDTDLCDEGTYSCVGAVQVCSDLTGDNVEVCDGLDNDCMNSIPGEEIDDDGDHYVECDSWEGNDPEIYGGNDCDDQDPDRSPGIEESTEAGNCEDEKDNDCDELTDTQDDGCPFGGCAAGPAD